MNKDAINTIIDRGFVFDEEMYHLNHSAEFETDRRMFWTRDDEEHFHGIILDETHFVLANQLAFVGGPRTTCGMVGVYKKKGHKLSMDHEKSFALWTKAGQAAIDYAFRNL